MRRSLLCLSLAFYSISAFAADSLVTNGNFEAATKNPAWPDGWGNGPSSGVTWEVEEGKHFLRLVSQKPGQTLMAYREVPIPAGTKGIEIFFRFRTAGVQKGAQSWFDTRSMFHFLDSNRKPVAPDPKPLVFSTKAATWTEASERVKVPEGAVSLQMMPSLFQVAAGTLDLSEVRVTPLDEAAMAEVTAAETAAAEKKAAAAAAKAAATPKPIDPKLSAQLAETGSLVSNGNFESATKNPAWPDGWGKGPSPGMTWEVDNGKHYLHMVSQSPGQTLMAYREVPIPPGVNGLEIYFRYRTAGIKKGTQSWFDARSMFHFLDSDRKPVQPDPKAMVFSTKAADWTEATQRTTVPAGAASLQMMPSLFQVAAGTLDLAEIRVKPMTDADVATMNAETAAVAKKKAEREAIIAADMAKPAITRELKVSGNKLVTPDGKQVWLQGLCTDSMQWSGGDNILWSIRVAIDEWKSNVIRLPVHEDPWFGRPIHGTTFNQQAYRQLVDDAVKLCAAKGAYLVLDLHEFGAPTDKHLEFWKDAAVRYKNNPAVLFELFNEPHGISWDLWRNGGSISADKHKVTDVNPEENKEKVASDISTGMQAIVDAVRATGAKNIIVSGGLDWSYDLTGIMNGYALDDKGGNGIMYVSHIYPWKKGWKAKVLVAADKYPIIITEIGCPRRWEDFAFIPVNQRAPLEGWSEDVLGMIQKYKLNWTGFSFHPHCGPMVIQDWDYTPTPYWGVFVKEALAGKQFEMKAMR